MFSKLKTLAVSLTLFISSAVYADLAIIGNPDSNAGDLDIQSTRKIFLGDRKSLPSGIHAVPMNHVVGSPDRKEFFSLVMNMPEFSYTRHWKRKMSTGIAHIPIELKSHKEVLRSIANTPGSIGYIDASKVDGTVKVLLIVKDFTGV